MAEVKIEVTAVDRTGGVLDKLSRSSGRLTGQTTALSAATSDTAAASGRASSNMRDLATAGGAAAVASGRLKGAMGQAMPLLTRVAGPLAAAYGLKQMKDVAQDFQSEMASVATLVNRTDAEMKAWGRDLTEMAPKVGRRASDLAGGLYQVVSAIGDTGGKMYVLETSAKAATAGLTDTFTAVDIITTGLNAYGMEASEAGTISDQLFTAVRLGKTTFPELAGSLGQVLPFAAQLKVEFGEVSAAMATLTSAGISTEIAATSLRAAMVSFIQNAEKFREAGVDILAVIEEDGLAGGLNALKEITGGNIQRMQEFIPETRALTAVLSLAGEQANKFMSAQRAMEQAAGATDAAFKKQAETADFAEAQFAAMFDRLSVAAGETFLPAIKAVVQGLTWFLDKFHDFGVAIGEGAAIWVGWFEGAFDAIERRISGAVSFIGDKVDWLKSKIDWIASGAGSVLSALGIAGEEKHSGGIVMHTGGAIPRFHSGGALAPDERLIIGQTGEGIVSRRGMDALNRINAGQVGQSLSFSPTININGAAGDAAELARKIERELANRFRNNRSVLRQAMEGA